MGKTVFTYGLIIGLVLSLYLLFFVSTFDSNANLATSEVLGYLFMSLAFLLMYFGIKKYRDTDLGGHISFGRVFGTGLLIMLVANTIYSLSWTVYTEVSDFDFEALYMEMTLKELNESGMSEEDIADVLEEMEPMMEMLENPFLKFFITIFEPLFPGILVSLIMGFILRRKPPELSTSE